MARTRGVEEAATRSFPRSMPSSVIHRASMYGQASPGQGLRVHCSTEITVTDFGASVRNTFPSWTFAATGVGATTWGASKVLTLSTFGAVRVSPRAALAAIPATDASIATG